MCGTPVIASKCSDTIIDTLKNNENGIIIDDYDDIDAYAENIFKLLNDNQFYKKISKNALDTAKMKNDIKIISSIWRDILKCA
jgi:glycosyltransferase involved in cell wall biosynthesis